LVLDDLAKNWAATSGNQALGVLSHGCGGIPFEGDLATAGGLIFAGCDEQICTAPERQDRRAAMALPPVKLLPHPITYSFKGRQYVAVEGSNVISF